MFTRWNDERLIRFIADAIGEDIPKHLAVHHQRDRASTTSGTLIVMGIVSMVVGLSVLLLTNGFGWLLSPSVIDHPYTGD